MLRWFGGATAFLIGFAIAAALAVHTGIGPIIQAFAAVGWRGLAMVCLLQLASLGVCALAWWCVTDGTSLGACVMARWIRDGASNLVGFIPAIGEGISARALSVFGASSAGAAASTTIVDVAVEALSQAVYTVVALALLFPHLAVRDEARWSLVVGLSLLPVLMMVAVSRFPGGLRLAQRIGQRVAGLMGLKPGDGGFSLADAVHTIYRRRGRVAAALVLHLLGWAMAAVQLWIAARGMAKPLDLGDCVALAGLVSAARSAFFVVPWAAGVQEGGFLLVGAALGVHPAVAIALSLVLRARDVLVGAPAILIWYLAEGRRSWARRAST